MTIDELLAAAGLTANDEIPIWDAEETGEPTKKITAANLASAVVALANLVTGVKGNAESAYRQGNVNLTPANIGAVASVTLYEHDGDRNTIWTEICKIPVGSAAPIFITGDGCSILTRAKLNKWISGIIARTNAVNVMIIASDSDSIYTWSVTGLDTDNYTPGDIIKCQGTVI